jgi:ABC-type uncharacterized transport system permease subunit
LYPTLRWTLERRAVPGSVSRYTAGAVLFGIAVSIILGIALSDGSPGSFFSALWQGTFGTAQGVESLMTLSFPLILLGLAASLPLRLGLWNIGGEGQLFFGAWAAAGVAFTWPGLPGAAAIPLMLLASMAVGAFWMLMPALARIYLGVNEIITTLLLNFIAGYWVLYWAGNPWRDPLSLGGVKSNLIPDQTQLSGVQLGSVLMPAGFLIAVVIAVVTWLVVRHSTFGFQVRILGASPRTARFAGISIHKLTIGVLLLGGAMAGLGGSLEMMGEIDRFGQALSNNTGYTGIVVAVLATGSELGVIVMAVVFAVITVIGNIVRVAGASSDLVFAMYGLTLVFAGMGQGLAQIRVVRRRVLGALKVSDKPATAGG